MDFFKKGFLKIITGTVCLSMVFSLFGFSGFFGDTAMAQITGADSYNETVIDSNTFDDGDVGYWNMGLSNMSVVDKDGSAALESQWNAGNAWPEATRYMKSNLSGEYMIKFKIKSDNVTPDANLPLPRITGVDGKYILQLLYSNGTIRLQAGADWVSHDLPVYGSVTNDGWHDISVYINSDLRQVTAWEGTGATPDIASLNLYRFLDPDAVTVSTVSFFHQQNADNASVGDALWIDNFLIKKITKAVKAPTLTSVLSTNFVGDNADTANWNLGDVNYTLVSDNNTTVLQTLRKSTSVWGEFGRSLPSVSGNEKLLKMRTKVETTDGMSLLRLFDANGKIVVNLGYGGGSIFMSTPPNWAPMVIQGGSNAGVNQWFDINVYINSNTKKAGAWVGDATNITNVDLYDFMDTSADSPTRFSMFHAENNGGAENDMGVFVDNMEYFKVTPAPTSTTNKISKVLTQTFNNVNDISEITDWTFTGKKELITETDGTKSIRSSRGNNQQYASVVRNLPSISTNEMLLKVRVKVEEDAQKSLIRVTDSTGDYNSRVVNLTYLNGVLTYEDANWQGHPIQGGENMQIGNWYNVYVYMNTITHKAGAWIDDNADLSTVTLYDFINNSIPGQMQTWHAESVSMQMNGNTYYISDGDDGVDFSNFEVSEISQSNVNADEYFTLNGDRTITKLEDNKLLNISAKVTGALDGTLVLAAYSSDGKLMKVTQTSFSVASGETKYVTTDGIQLLSVTGVTAKAFLLSSTADVQPLKSIAAIDPIS